MVDLPRPDEQVTVGFLHPGEVAGEFAMSLAAMMTYNPGRIEARIARTCGPLVAHGRNQIIDMFLSSDLRSDWLLFIDADMVWERDAVENLLAGADPDERPVVGGLCFTGEGKSGIRPVMMRYEEGKGHGHVYTVPDNTLVPVDATGAAFLMVHRKVLLDVRTNYPFPFQESTEGPRIVGEDVDFCRKVRQLGYPIYVHTGVPIGHYKSKVVGINDWRLQQWDYKTADRSLKFVVAGTGRSGTGYTSQVFTKLGLPCGHEEIWNPYEYRKRGLLGDSSWLAVPYLDDIKQRDIKVFHQIRHPVKVVSSLLGDSSLTASSFNPYRQFKEEHCPYIQWTPESLVEDAMRFWVDWNQRIEPYADLTWRLEDFGVDQLKAVADILGAPYGPDDDPAFRRSLNIPPWKRNKHGTVPVTWDELPEGDAKDEVAAMAERYGYTL